MVASIGHYIGNKPVTGKSGRTGDITNPATGEVTARVAFASVEEVDQAVQGGGCDTRCVHGEHDHRVHDTDGVQSGSE